MAPAELKAYNRKASRKYRTTHPERERHNQRSHDLKRNYGMTVPEYDSLLASQGGVCAICKTLPEKRRLDVDHDHTTGKVRGLLCPNCNNGLGRFLDSTKFLSEAITYLLKTV